LRQRPITTTIPPHDAETSRNIIPLFLLPLWRLVRVAAGRAWRYKYPGSSGRLAAAGVRPRRQTRRRQRRRRRRRRHRRGRCCPGPRQVLWSRRGCQGGGGGVGSSLNAVVVG
ncbi:unnamed protein product, partial [Ectocarpus sp. 12 AP-2014]